MDLQLYSKILQTETYALCIQHGSRCSRVYTDTRQQCIAGSHEVHHGPERGAFNCQHAADTRATAKAAGEGATHTDQSLTAQPAM